MIRVGLGVQVVKTSTPVLPYTNFHFFALRDNKFHQRYKQNNKREKNWTETHAGRVACCPLVS